MKQRMSRAAREDQIFQLLNAQPDCYFTHGQISRAIGLKATPYTRTILLDMIDHYPHLHKIAVRAGNQKEAWGYYYSQTSKQEMLPCL